MPTIPLPEEPSLEQLKKQAKDLLKAVRSGNPDSLAFAAEQHPGDLPSPFTLSAAQLVTARLYGFPSWPRLRRHLDVVARYQRVPDRVPESADPAAEFLRLTCLNYGKDDPARWRQACALLAEHPEIGEAGIHAAAATANVTEVRRLLAADPELARAEGGPFDWQPLFYLAYARHDPDIDAEPVLGTARALLDAGADPNAGYLWHGLPMPFTVLTGVLGNGEGGQPPHPHAFALARLLLRAGANPNDGQALYNRMFSPDNDHLRLLFEFGLGTEDGGPWRERLGDQLSSPAEMLRAQLRWAIVHGMGARIALFAEHGVDLRSPYADGRVPVEIALLSGFPAVAEQLVEAGADDAELGPVSALIAAVLVADRDTVDLLRAVDPTVVDRAKSARPALVVWAAALGRVEAVRLALELGFDVDALGRTDVPRDQPWETALHHAAGNELVELAEVLLAAGADPAIRDARFHHTPLEWARHFHRPAMIALLAPAGDR
jgi:ankyrin repeat protein